MSTMFNKHYVHWRYNVTHINDGNGMSSKWSAGRRDISTLFSEQIGIYHNITV